MWRQRGETVVALEVADELSLFILASELVSAGAVVARFFEPDMGNELTSIACFVDEKSARLLKTLTCALRESVSPP